MGDEGPFRILCELGFFLVIITISEAVRCLVKRSKPESAAVRKLLICSLVSTWYSISITLVLFNKWVIGSWKDGGLKFPTFYTMCHMFLKGIFSFVYLKLVKCRPLFETRCRVVMGALFVGLMTGLDVAASNVSFLYISVSFYTMLKSASLIFICVLGGALRIEPCSLPVVGTVLTIALGIFLASYGEARFSVLGFWCVISSEVFAAMRWLATQVLLQKGELDPMSTVFHMSPASTLSLAPIVAARELKEVSALGEEGAALEFGLMVLFPGFLAFLLLLVEVTLVKVTSSLTLSVFGGLKSVVTILFSILVFGESTTALQWCGLLVALAGILAYSRAKKKALAVDALAHLEYHMLPQDGADDFPADAPSPGGKVEATVLGSASVSIEDGAPQRGPPPRPGGARRAKPLPLSELDDREDAIAITHESPVAVVAQELKQQLATIAGGGAALHGGSAPEEDTAPRIPAPGVEAGSPAASEQLDAARIKLATVVAEAAAVIVATSPVAAATIAGCGSDAPASPATSASELDDDQPAPSAENSE